LQQALDSLVRQDFEDFEIVICDNASTDQTQDMCRSYAARDRRIRYYRNETNIGSAPNYRKVFELASGDVFKWHAHDDVCYPMFLSRCYAALMAAPPYVALVYPRSEFIDAQGQVLERDCDHLESRAVRPHKRLATVLRNVSHGGPLWGMIRAEYLRKTQLSGPVSYWDDLLLAELSLLGELREVHETLLQVRSYPGNAVALFSAAQGPHVARDPAKANRTTRQALRAWNDPSKASRRIWLPIREERCVEYLKRVHGSPIGIGDRFMCYLTVPAVTYWSRFKKVGGLWKRRLLGAEG
jgi:glycosyltransferase involved in cell wall biosynthesis